VFRWEAVADWMQQVRADEARPQNLVVKAALEMDGA
jgi:hypothetical protein